MGAYEKISAQQGQKGTSKWMIGEQLKDILRREPDLAHLVEEDLETLSLDGCAEAMRRKADELHKETGGRCVCIPPDVAEAVIRKYFGLPEAGAPAPVPAAIPQQTQEPAANPQQGGSFIDLDAFF